MPDFVLDYSGGWPRNIAPYLGVIRYVGTPDRPKNLTQAEADRRQLDGTPMALVYETTAGWMLGGYPAGVRAAGLAQADAQRLGVPWRCIYFACDVDVTSAAQLAAVDACLDGAASMLGRDRVGVYGEADVIDHCMAGGKAAYGWQTRAWSGGRTSARACLRQEIGYVSVDGVGQLDRNTVLKDDWGQWPYETGGILVTLTATEEQEVLAAARQINGAVGYGQRDYQGTVEATLATVQALINRVNQVAGSLGQAITGARDQEGAHAAAVLGAVAALPTVHLSDEERQQLAGQIADTLSKAGIAVDSAPLLDALAARLAPKAATA